MPYEVATTFEISASHCLDHLPYDSPCRRSHGHNWKITVHCRSETLNAWGMVEDFAAVQTLVRERFDHRHLNDVLDVPPTAENLARWIVDAVATCYRCVVQESEGNVASYETAEC